MAGPVIRALFKRDLKRWFGNPTGYVFITLFVLLAAAALYGPDEFFQNNLANLDSLNAWFPWLVLFFVPAITMSVWAGERGQGTDELLFTLPATDTQIVVGKYLAAAGIYTVALLFSTPLLLFLEYIGDPDWGLLVANALGIWLFGLVLVAVGMVGSQLSDNLTVAFIFGAFLCSIVVVIESILGFFSADLLRPWLVYGPSALFEELGRGVVSLGSLAMFGGLIVGFLYLNLLLLSRRHWRQGERTGAHLGVRFVSILVAALSLTVIGANLGPRLDTTAERLHSLSEATATLIREIDPARPVTVHAYVSPDVPRDYVQTRRTLLDLLRQYEALGGDRLLVRVIETNRFTDEAREAEQRFGIQHQEVVSDEGGQTRSFGIFLGVAFQCGLDEVVVPFLDRGLSVEYELTRSIRTVASAKRLKVGLLDNDVRPFGGFEWQSMRQDPQWDIVRELELQYEVQRVAPGTDYPEDLDALIALMPSSLLQEELDRLAAYIRGGGKTLLVDDPFPAANPALGPSEPKGGAPNPFQQQQPPAPPKGDIVALLDSIGIRWPPKTIVWDTYTPHPQFLTPQEYVFVSANQRGGSMPAFNPEQPITSGLQELVVIFGGHVQEAQRPGLRFVPLLRTSPASGTLDLDQVLQRNFFGGRALNPARRHIKDGREKVLACRVSGTPSESDRPLDVIFVADLDLVSSQFFQLRRQGFEDLQFDNVTFILNCVDELAGQTEFIDLRKRRPQHRTLVRLESEEERYSDEWLRQKELAEEQAQDRLTAAQESLDRKVAAIAAREDLDARAKEIQIQTVREVEQRRLDAQRGQIEDEKEQAIENALSEKTSGENRIRMGLRLLALVVSPVPGLLLGFATLLRRRRRERESIIGVRRVGGA